MFVEKSEIPEVEEIKKKLMKALIGEDSIMLGAHLKKAEEVQGDKGGLESVIGYCKTRLEQLQNKWLRLIIFL